MCSQVKQVVSNDLDVAKQKLLDKLGPNYTDYIRLLGKWFRGIISKEEFDRSAKHLIDQNFILEHNKFWLAFFHHCANNINGHNHPNSCPNSSIGALHHDQLFSDPINGSSTDKNQTKTILNDTTRVRCLPNKVITHMKIFVIAWEMGLDSADDQVSSYINLALKHFLKNIITELISTKTAYRLRENRFKYAMGVKPMNPYLNNSLRVYTSNLEYDPYQIESNKMNSSILDTCIYNDTLFPSRLYEAQALYEYACSTTSTTKFTDKRRAKRLKLSDIFLNQNDDEGLDCEAESTKSIDVQEDLKADDYTTTTTTNMSDRRSTMFHLLIAFINNKSIVPSHSLYSINLERIFNRLSC